MYSEPSLDSALVWLKLTTVLCQDTLLCSYKEDEDLGHRCLLTDDEGPADTLAFGKFRWNLIPVEWSDDFIISNVEFGGRLYVSDYTFQSAEKTVASVYVRPANSTIDLREVWHIEHMAGDLCRVINTFNGQVLCGTCVEANSKGDRWAGVVDQSGDDRNACIFVMQLLEVGC